LAVIGLGKMGLLHASLFSTFPEARLVALCDKSRLLTKIGKKLFAPKEVQVVNNLDDLSGLDLDAVYVTTPISSHSSIVNNLVEAGIAKNFFVEKTLSSSYKDSRNLCELIGRVQGKNMVGYMKRFNVVFKKAKTILENQEVGVPLSFEAFAYSSDFQGSTSQSKSSAPRGGALRDIGCHIVDLSLWLLGDFEVSDVLSSEKTGLDSKLEVSFNVQKQSLHGNFKISQKMTNYRMPEFGLSIACSKGKIEVNDDRLFLTDHCGKQTKWYKQDLSDNVQFYLGESEYYRENRQFIELLLNNQSAPPDFESASKVDNIISQVKLKE
jgi:predicted dehydrogenase